MTAQQLGALAFFTLVAVTAFTVHRWRARRWILRFAKSGANARLSARRLRGRKKHVIFAFVDHFEPRWRNCNYETERARVGQWCEQYPRLCKGLVDSDGVSPQHSFFYPEEEYRPEHLSRLSDLCRAGYGEIEVHLHHDNDTDQGLREKLRRFTRVLHEQHGALVRVTPSGPVRWGFIHGNWALDNSRADGRWCGVNNELSVLREEGCYADFTFPSAPDGTQPSLVNAIYYATDDPTRARSHDSGDLVRVGGREAGDLMIIQGPLRANWASRKYGVFPRLENSDVRLSQPPTASRVDSWVRAGISVVDRPEWVFVKIHTHGTQEPDMPVLLGTPMRAMFEYLQDRYNDGKEHALHYVTAREMYNIIKAAEAGVSGDPGDYRSYSLPQPANRRR